MANTKDIDRTPPERRRKWYKHPLPYLIVLCFEVCVCLITWAIVHTALNVDECAINAWVLPLLLHPLATLATTVATRFGPDDWWWRFAIAPSASLVIFGGLQWYALTWAGIGIYRWQRRSQRPSGRCPACRYNLTGNTSGTCPECGTPIADAVRKELSDAEA